MTQSVVSTFLRTLLDGREGMKGNVSFGGLVFCAEHLTQIYVDSFKTLRDNRHPSRRLVGGGEGGIRTHGSDYSEHALSRRA